MPESPTSNHATSVAGGASATPTPANNVGGGAGWGDSGFQKGGSHDTEGPRQGFGHVAPANARETMGEALGLREQKDQAKFNFMQRVDDAGDVKPTTEHGEPTCTTEDHSFMGKKPGGSDALPGWETVKNVLG
ncbi:FAD dependent oxidoreductase, partial [Penicillium longicatenatum]